MITRLETFRRQSRWSSISGNPKIAFLDDMPYAVQGQIHTFVSWAPLTRFAALRTSSTRRARQPLLIYYQPHDYWHVVPGARLTDFGPAQFDVRIVQQHGSTMSLSHLPGDQRESAS